MDASQFARYFAQALPYADYIITGTPEHNRRWTSIYTSTALNAAQGELVSGFTREMKVLVLSGLWCGDCVEQCPLLARIAEGNPERIDLRFIDRDAESALRDAFSVCAGARVPVAIFLAEDFY